MIRVFHVILPSMGGSAKAGLNLADALNRSGDAAAETWALAPSPFGGAVSLNGGAPPADLESACRLADQWTIPARRQAAQQLARLCRARRPDVVHFHYALPMADLAARLRTLLKHDTPLLVLTLHGTDASRFAAGANSQAAWSLAAQLRKLDLLSAVSEAHRELCLEVFGNHLDVRTVPNSVNLSHFTPPEKRVHGARLLHVSNFRPVKNPRKALRIWLRLRERGIKASLTFAGDGPERSAVETLARSFPHADGNVHFTGFLDDLQDVYRQTDALLVTSDRESFSLAALEAMACATVPATDLSGALHELLLPPDEPPCGITAADEDALTRELEDYLRSTPVQRQNLVRRACRRAAAFDDLEVARRWLTLYRSRLEKQRGFS